MRLRTLEPLSPGVRSTIPLRNDENQVCSRSAQPPRVPVGRSPCDTSCQHDQRATDLLGWPSLVGLAARQLSRPLGKHDMCVTENALVEASVRIRVRVDVDVDAQGAGAPCDGC